MLQLPFSVQSLTDAPVVASYGPFAAVEDAFDFIPKGRRHDGLTIKLINGTEYWWLFPDFEDADLKKKILGSEMAELKKILFYDAFNGFRDGRQKRGRVDFPYNLFPQMAGDALDGDMIFVSSPVEEQVYLVKKNLLCGNNQVFSNSFTITEGSTAKDVYFYPQDNFKINMSQNSALMNTTIDGSYSSEDVSPSGGLLYCNSLNDKVICDLTMVKLNDRWLSVYCSNVNYSIKNLITNCLVFSQCQNINVELFFVDISNLADRIFYQCDYVNLIAKKMKVQKLAVDCDFMYVRAELIETNVSIIENGDGIDFDSSIKVLSEQPTALFDSLTNSRLNLRTSNLKRPSYDSGTCLLANSHYIKLNGDFQIGQTLCQYSTYVDFEGEIYQYGGTVHSLQPAFKTCEDLTFKGKYRGVSSAIFEDCNNAFIEGRFYNSNYLVNAVDLAIISVTLGDIVMEQANLVRNESKNYIINVVGHVEILAEITPHTFTNINFSGTGIVIIAGNIVYNGSNHVYITKTNLMIDPVVERRVIYSVLGASVISFTRTLKNGDSGIINLINTTSIGETITLPANSIIGGNGTGYVVTTALVGSRDRLFWEYDGSKIWWSFNENYN